MPIVRPVSSEEWNKRQSNAAATRAVEEKKQAARQNREDWNTRLNSGYSVPTDALMKKHLDKQMSRATAVSKSGAHGVAMSERADEFAGRIARAISGNELAAKDLDKTDAHVEAARRDIKNHHDAHGAGDSKEALRLLASAGGHLVNAAQAVPAHMREMISDAWIPNRSDRAKTANVPWRVPASEDPTEHKNFVSLENIAGDVRGIVGAYRQHIHDAGAEGIKDLSKEPMTPVSTNRSMFNRVYEQQNRDVNNLAQQRDRRAHFDAGTETGE